MVTGNHSDLPKLPLRLTALQILGLRDPCEGDWARVRSLQYARLDRGALTRMASHGLATLITVTMFAGTVCRYGCWDHGWSPLSSPCSTPRASIAAWPTSIAV